jgi:hypothetical protein
VFLLVEIRIDIERFLALLPCTSVLQPKLTHLYLTISIVPDPLPILIFKVSVLVPVQWGHQTLSCFGFPTYPHTSCMCSPLSMWPKSNHIAAFALDLKSAYEGEHTIFGLLSLANLAQDNGPSSIHLLANDKISFFFMAE